MAGGLHAARTARTGVRRLTWAALLYAIAVGVTAAAPTMATAVAACALVGAACLGAGAIGSRTAKSQTAQISHQAQGYRSPAGFDNDRNGKIRNVA